MALTRAQYLAPGGSSPVLAGQVQGVKQGTGVVISSDGTISVDPVSVQGLVRLNNPSAYNNYIWPIGIPSTPSVLSVSPTGQLSWIAGGAGGIGTVTSVNISGGTSGLVFTGGPITTSGVITLSGGVLSVANGGTGTTSQAGAANNILPPQAGQAGKFLTTDGANVSWATAGGGSAGVTQIVAGSNITISPVSGTGVVTINSTGGGGGGGGLTGLQEIDDIESQFNGTAVTFALTVSGGQAIPAGTNVGQLIIAVGGILQSPGDSFTWNDTNDTITFSSAPPTGATFTGYIGGTSSQITTITPGAGLAGGGTTGDVTLSLAPSGVTAGSYTNTNLTVDQYGRITAASNGSGGAGGVTQIIAGSGIEISPVGGTGAVTVSVNATTVAADVDLTTLPVLI